MMNISKRNVHIMNISIKYNVDALNKSEYNVDVPEELSDVCILYTVHCLKALVLK